MTKISLIAQWAIAPTRIVNREVAELHYLATIVNKLQYNILISLVMISKLALMINPH